MKKLIVRGWRVALAVAPLAALAATTIAQKRWF
jgi:hypothetical protein